MTLSVPDSAAPLAAPDDSAGNGGKRESTGEALRANILLLLVLFVASVFAYKDVLFSWFSGDDFVHLCWLAKAVNEPNLVLRNFYANWLDAFGSAFYRPLVSVSLYFDYLLWHNNGLGFHITNFLFHFMTVSFLYLFVQEIQVASSKKRNGQPGNNYLWPFFAAGLFALHPIHPEVVSWIIGRVDSVATAFVTSTLYFYAHWRATNSRGALIGGVASMVLALCSKEIAVLLPPVLTMYELCFGPGVYSSLLAKAKALKPLIGFWILLAGYFLLRQLALGTWLGGYDNSLGLGIPFSQWLAQTWHGLMITFIPVNADVISNSNALVRIWIYGTSISALMLLILAVQRRFLREMIFAFSFTVLALLPVYKIFFVLNSNLEASRYAYLLTVPLCMLLGLGIAHLSVPRVFNKNFPIVVRTIFGITILVGAFGLLRFNNMPWHEAGVTANAVLTGLESILGPSRQQVAANVVLVGPPDAYKGAYICRNAIDFMMQHLNIAPKRSAGVVTILDKQKIFPMSNIRMLMEKNPQAIEIWHWNLPEKRFDRVQPLVTKDNSERSWSLAQFFPGLASIPASFNKILRWEHGALFVDAKKEAVVVHANLSDSSTWNLNFLTMTVSPDPDSEKGVAPCLAIPSDRGNVYIAGMPLKVDSTLPPTAADAGNGTGTEILVFPLRSIPAWALNYTKAPSLPVIFQAGWKGKLVSVKSIPPQQIMPLTSLHCFGGGNFYRLWTQYPEGALSVDVSSIKGATGWALEVIPTLDQFSQGNPTKPELNAKIERFQGTRADYKLKLHDLPEGFYCLRVWALDKDNQYIGVGSDHYRVQFKD